MKTITAWLFDILPQKDYISSYWITEEKTTIKCFFKQVYASIYAYSSSHLDFINIKAGLLSHPMVVDVKLVKKRISIHNKHFNTVYEILVPLYTNKQKFIHEIRDIFPLALFNTDLSNFQYFYHKTGIFPFCKARISLDQKNYITNVTLLDKLNQFKYELPPVKAIQIDITFASSIKKDYITKVTFTLLDSKLDEHKNNQIVLQQLPESKLILETIRWINNNNIDVLVTHGGDVDLRVFATRAVFHGLGHLSLSREKYRDQLFRVAKHLPKGTSYMSYGGHFYKDHGYYLYGGRHHIDLRNSFTWKDGGFAGIVELARLSCIDPQRCARTSIGTNLTGMQIRQALTWDILIPSRKADAERFRSGESLIVGDRGGFIYSPRVGLHFNVAGIDYSSMFPNIMVKHNISPETINCQCCNDGTGKPIPGTNWYTCQERKGLVPLVLKTVLDKRLFYKQFKDTSKSYDQLQKTLKWILVTCFGYQGYRNARFGRIEAHEAINAYARQSLLVSGEIMQKHGFEIVAGIVDSIWGKFPDQRTVDPALIKDICQEIEEDTELPISHEGTFRWIIFLPRRHEPEVGVLNRYYGCFEDGSFKVRGIELRRRDTSEFIRTAQAEALETLAPATNRQEFYDLLTGKFWEVHEKYDFLLRNRNVPVEDLFIKKVIAKEPSQYKQAVHQAIAAQQLTRVGVHLQSGMKVSFLVTNSTAKSTGKRVIASDIYKGQPYDMQWYRKMLKEAFTNIIPPSFTEKIPESLKLEEFTNLFQNDYITKMR